MYQKDLTLNNQQLLICYKTKPTKKCNTNNAFL